MEARAKVQSENARHVILMYEDGLYYVSQVNVRLREGEKMHAAVFHARRAIDNKPENLPLDITRNLYDVLVGYTRLNDSDLILLLRIENHEFKWNLISEKWLKQQTSTRNASKYIV